jgi:hypothetical protein
MPSKLCIVVNVGMRPVAFSLEDHKAMQRIIGGMMQWVPKRKAEGLQAYVNEDGIELGLPRNHAAEKVLKALDFFMEPGFDIVCGNMILFNSQPDGKEIDVTVEQIMTVESAFNSLD